MGLISHHVSTESLLCLARGSGGSEVVTELAAAEYSKHLLLIRGIVDTARKTGHQQAHLARQAYNLLAVIQDRHPDAVDSVIRHPAAGSWALRTLSSLLRQATPEGATPGGLARLSAAACLRVGADFSISVPADDGFIMLPSIGRIKISSNSRAARIRSAGQHISLDADGFHRATSARGLADLREWQAMRSVRLESGGLSLSLLIDDMDPYRMPVSASPAERLDAAEFYTWQRRLAGAWDLLVCHHRSIALEICAAIRVLTPLRSPQPGIRSATSHETFGAIGMSLPSNDVTAAVTLVHEVQHAKLTALLDQITLTRPDDGRRFYAPWRNDPRPVSGLIQGAYAHLGVSAFWRRQRHVETGTRRILAHAEFARWRKAALEVTELLSRSGRLTSEGNVFVAGMLATLKSWNSEMVPAQALQIAQRDADEHLIRWKSRNSITPI